PTMTLPGGSRPVLHPPRAAGKVRKKGRGSGGNTFLALGRFGRPPGQPPRHLQPVRRDRVGLVGRGPPDGRCPGWGTGRREEVVARVRLLRRHRTRSKSGGPVPRPCQPAVGTLRVAPCERPVLASSLVP